MSAKYIFIRLGIISKSFFEGICTPKELLYCKIEELHRYEIGTNLRVTSKNGTNITLAIKAFTTCSHEIIADGEMAFLPPSETSAEVIAGSANGKVVVDVTVGQLYYYGELLGYF